MVSICRRLSALILLTASAWTLPAESLPSAEAARVLSEVLAKNAAPATADFTETRTSSLLAQPVVNRGTITRDGSGKFHRELRSGESTICDGETLWIYHPRFKTVEVYSLARSPEIQEMILAATATLPFSRVESLFRYQVTRENNTLVIDLTPRRAQMRRLFQRLQIRLSPEGKLERSILSSGAGEQVETVFHNERPATPPARLFQFSIPPDATVTRPLG